MDADKRKTWAAALRSGKYTQTSGQLRDTDNNMCCLGVAIDVFCPNRWAASDRGWADVGDTLHSPDNELPTRSTQQLLGLTGEEVETFAMMNDDYMQSFADIANHLESGITDLADWNSEENAEDAMDELIQLTQAEMVATFTEWERRYREEPEKFMHDVHRFTLETPETYGDNCARTFVGYLDEIRAGYAA